MKSGEIISASEQGECYRQSQEIECHWCVYTKGLFHLSGARLTGSIFVRATPEKIKVKRCGDQQLGPIANRKCEKGASDKRRRSHQGEIKGRGFSQQRETESDLPCTAHSKVAPGPGSKDRKER